MNQPAHAMNGDPFVSIRRRQNDINRRIRALEAILAYSKVTPDLRVMVSDEAVCVQADNDRLIADIARVSQEFDLDRQIPA